jgi:hypothetical protein
VKREVGKGEKNEMIAIGVGLKKQKTRTCIQYFLDWVLLTLLYRLDKLSCKYLCQFLRYLCALLLVGLCVG